VLTDFDGKIPYIIDGGPTNVGLESTVIDIQRDPPLILRPGGITLEMLREFLPTIRVYNKQGDGGLEIHPPTPGMKYRHYAPHAQLLLLIGDPKKIHTIIVDRVNKAIQNGKRVGILQTHPDSFYTELSGLSDNCLIINLGPTSDLALIAQNLFRGMRDLDAAGVEIIFAEGVGEINEGLAIMNRLRKAASEEINVNELKS
jgi:L-threonylcarbamoyladenylate synthase